MPASATHAPIDAAAEVMRARDRVARHLASTASGSQLSAFATDLFEAIVLGVYGRIEADLEAAGQGCLSRHVALVAHGGFGRREMAPYSDIDLMLLHDGGPSGNLVAEAAGRILKDLFDAGLEVGQSVRTPRIAVQLALEDATIFSSLFDSRLIAGNAELFAVLERRMRAIAGRHPTRLARRVTEARAAERRRFGERAAVLEPNVKRSPGGLRDIQLVRWLGGLEWKERSIDALALVGGLSKSDADALRDAGDFLTRVRFEMHVAAGRAVDELTRDEQLRIAESRGIGPEGGLLGVERFMREYFSHTRAVARIATAMERRTQRAGPIVRGIERCFGHRIGGPYRLEGRVVSVATSQVGCVAGDLSSILRLFELAILFNRTVDPDTLEAIRAELRPQELAFDGAARQRFLALLEHPQRLAEALGGLHDLGVLERIVPSFAHAKGLMQFNNYHKFTVDEHCIHAVERAAEFAHDDGWLGTAWRQLRRRRPLIIALLVHDLGKGHLEDHSIVGAAIARDMATRLQLPADEAEIVEFLVANHLVMAHLAFRRDVRDESLVVRFAGDVGSPEVLRMLAVLTAADVSAVGPGTWNRWKSDLLGALYARTLEYLDGESPTASVERTRDAVVRLAETRGCDEATCALARSLPSSMLQSGSAEEILSSLDRFASLGDAASFVEARWQPSNATVSVTVGTREAVAPGVFHRLTGAVSSQRLGILSADIHTFGDGLVLDHFTVHDPDFAGEPPPHRLAEIAEAVRRSLDPAHTPSFQRRWMDDTPPAATIEPRVRIDNESSELTTILEVFTHDSPGLLYTIAKTLFESGVSVRSARIGTYLDQVVDAFHVTGVDGRKLTDAERLERLRESIRAVISRPG